MVSAEGPVNAVSEIKSVQAQEPTVIEAPQVLNEEAETSEQIVDETREGDEGVVAEAEEMTDDAGNRNRKKSRDRKPDANEAFSNKLEVSET